MIAPWTKSYIGIPFKPKGRDRDGCDCYGLVCLVYREQFGIRLPQYTASYDADVEMAHVAALVKNEADAAWSDVREEDTLPGDVMLIRRLGYLSHVGLFVGDHKMLHCDRGHDSVIEDIRSGKWDMKIAGFYRFAGAQSPKALGASNVLVTARTSPFSQLSMLSNHPPTMTLAEIVEAVAVPEHFKAGIAIRLDGGDVPPYWWPHIRPKAGHHVEVVVVPSGQLAEALGTSTMTMRTALMTIFVLGGTIANEMIGGPEGWIIGALISVFGVWASQQIKPPALPAEDIGYQIGGSGGVLKPFDPVPLVFGAHRIYPQFAAMPYTEAAGRDQYLHLLYLVGLGPLDVSGMRIGDQPLENFEGVETEVLRGAAGDPALTLYEGDVNELTLKNPLKQELENVWNLPEGDGEGEYTAAELGWIIQTSSPNPEHLSIDISFLRGLIKLHDGDPRDCAVSFDVQMRELPFGEWLAFNPFQDKDDYAAEPDVLTTSIQLDFLAVMEQAFTNLNAQATAVPSAQQAAPQEVLDRLSWRMGKLSARLDDLKVRAPDISSNISLLQTQVDALADKFALWTITTEAGTTVKARNVINLTVDYYESARSLAESIMAVSGKNPAAMLAQSPWWRRWCMARWFRQSIRDLFKGGTCPVANKRRWFKVEDRYNGIVRVSAKWGVESDTDIEGEGNRYEVRIRRLSVEEESDKYQIYDEATWTALRSHYSASAVTRDDVALVALRIKASDQLNGTISNFNCMAEALTPYYDGTVPVPDYADWPTKVTSNPAWAYLRVLCDPKINRRAASVDRLDVDRLAEWATACESADPPRTFDLYLQKRITAFRLMGEIASVGRAAFGMRDGKFSIVRDLEQSIPVQHFTPRNSWGFKASRSLIDKPHAIRARFLNAAADYEQDEIYVYNDGYDANNATRFEDMEFTGMTTAAAVHREARYHLAVAELRPEVVQFETDIEHLVCNAGDLVLVTHDVPMWGLMAGRVKGVDGTAIMLDEPVPMELGKTYGIRFRLADGSTALRGVATAPGYQSAVTLGSAVAGLAAGDLFMFGESGKETRELIIKEIRPKGENNAEIRCLDHAPEVHTSDTEEIPDYEPGVTRPPVIELRQLPAPVIGEIVTDERAIERDTYGTLRNRIILEVSWPAHFRGSPPLYMEAEFKKSTSPNWIRLPVQRSDMGEVAIGNVQHGQLYDVRVRYTEGGLFSDWTYALGIDVIGQLTPPSAGGFELWLEGGNVLRWRYPEPPPDLAGFEIRYAHGLSVEWAKANHLHEGVLTGRSYTLPNNLHGTVTFEIRAVDVVGNYSLTGAQLILGLGDRIPKNVVKTLPFSRSIWNYSYNRNMDLWWETNTMASVGWTPDMYSGDGDPMYDGADGDPFYACIFPEASVVRAIDPHSTIMGTQVSLDADVHAGPYRVEYRPCQLLYTHYLNFWPENLDDDLWPEDPLHVWRPFQGEFTVEYREPDGFVGLPGKSYELRWVFEPGMQQALIKNAQIVMDVPDIEETLEDVAIETGGSRLPITKTYRQVVAVQLAIQNAHEEVATAQVVDRSNTGPKIICYNRYGASVPGVIDAHIKGY